MGESKMSNLLDGIDPEYIIQSEIQGRIKISSQVDGETIRFIFKNVDTNKSFGVYDEVVALSEGENVAKEGIPAERLINAIKELSKKESN